jgi:aminopeptidase YwaD
MTRPKLREYLPGWNELGCHFADIARELAARPAPDPRLAAALSGITADELEKHIHELTSGGPRWREDEENVLHALRYLRDELAGYGYTVVDEPYGEAPHQVNLLATLDGRDSAAPLLEIGAHWDSVQGSPGADDNASGVAGVLAAARVLGSLGERERGIRFCLFGEEEEWMIGSREHVAAVDAAGEAVEGLIVLEMIGFRDARHGAQRSPLRIPGVFSPPHTADFIAVIADLRSLPFVNAVRRSARQYVPGLHVFAVKRLGGMLRAAARSDHLRYWRTRRRGLLVTDTANLRNPHYHKATDTLSTLDLDFAADVTRAVVGAAAQLADRAAH